MNASPGRSAALIWCPFPDADSARTAAAALLEARLIACANIMPPCESHFIWNGTIEAASEVPALFKTTAQHLAEAVDRLGALHPYDSPAIVGWRADAAHPATLDWLLATLAP